MNNTASITMLLGAARGGDAEATASLFNVVYRELKVLARSHRRRWRGNETLNTTALIGEVFVKLSGDDAFNFANRTHFYATASKAMRQILVNYANRQRAAKRGGEAVRVTLDETVFSAETTADEVLNLHEALQHLETTHPRACRVIECRGNL
ncbi:MAG: ECF-type sigma factor, partial [Pseudomonadota bacterium]